MAALTDIIRPLVTEAPDVLDILIGSPIKSLCRVYYEGDIEKVQGKVIEKSKVINFLTGPVIIEFEDGNSIGFNGEDTRESVVCWFEVLNGIRCDEYFFYRDNCKYLYHDDIYTSNKFFSNIIGCLINQVAVYNFPAESKPGLLNNIRQKIIEFRTDRGVFFIVYSLSLFPSFLSLVERDDLPDTIFKSSQRVIVLS